MRLEQHLRARREAGAKLLVPYVTGGLGSQWLDVVRAAIDSGADAVEVGIPFSRSKRRRSAPSISARHRRPSSSRWVSSTRPFR